MPAQSRVSLIAGLLAAALFAGPAEAQTTVTMWTFLDPNKTSPREVALKQMLAEFEKANPTIKVRVEPQDFAQMPQKFYLGHRTGTNPDIVFIDTKTLSGLYQSSSGADLNALMIKNWSEADRKDFFARVAWDAGTHDGKQVAVPVFHGGTVIYYRKDLLAAAGIDPKSLKTWDGIVEAAKRLTVDRDKDGRVDVWGFGMPLAPLKTEATPVLIGLLDGPEQVFDGCKARFATDTGVKALNYTADLITKHKVTPQEALVTNVDDITDQFIAGRYAIAISSNLRYSVIAGRATFGGGNFDLIKWPSWSGEKPGKMPLSGWFVSVWAKSPRQAEAARFVDYMVGREGVRLWSTVGGQIPTRSSVLEDLAFSKPESAWVRTMIEAWGESGFMEPVTCNTRTMQGALNEAVARVIIDKVDPKAALVEAEKKFSEAQ